MKKTFKFFAAAIAIVAAASCAKELNKVENGTKGENLVKVTFSAGLEDTKSYLDGNQVVWEEGDSIAVWDGTAKRSFKLVSVSGKDALFTGEVDPEAKDFHIVYPYTSFVSVTGDSLAFTIPVSQVVGTHASVKDALVCTAHTTDLSGIVQLKNAVSLVKFSFEGAGATSVILLGAGEEKFVGQAYTKDGGATVACTSKGTSQLTVTPEAGTFVPGTYYAVVAPCNFATGLTAIYGNATEKGKITTENAVNFVRNGGINLKSLDNNAKTVKVPSELKTTADLVAFGEMMPYYVAGETVKLGNDISLQDQTWNGGTFRGILDGQSHSISHINITTDGDAAFINILYGTVKDIKFGTPGDGSLIKCAATVGKSYYIGAIGKVLTDGQLTDVENYVGIEVDTIGYYVGGLCSYYSSAKSISGCKNHGNVTHKGPSTSTINLAGLISSVGYATTIENCENDGAITYAGKKPFSTVNHGGLVGYTGQAVTFKNCKNSGVVKVSSTVTEMGGGVYRLGGILGLNQGAGVTMENCENTGNVICEANGFSKKALYLGGLMGQNESKSTTGITLTDCTNSGELTSSIAGNAGITAIGGMVGYRAMSSTGGALGIAKLTRCSNIGNILDNGKRSATGTNSYIAGMIAYNLMGATLTDCTNGMEGEEFGTLTKNTPASATTANVCKFGVVGGMIGWQGAPTTSAYSTSTVSLSGCHNYAAISNLKDGGSTYVYLGSMIAGNEPTTVSSSEKYYDVTIDNCVNDGAITNLSTGNDQVRMGGFIGDGANNFTLKNSTNNGEVSSSCAVTKTTVQYRVGGFVGSMTKGTNGKQLFTDLVNTGNVSAVNTSTTVTAAAIAAGGIAGFMSKSSNKYTRCKSNAAIAASGATKTYVKAIIGDTTAACTITDCSLAGSCNGEAITSENFSSYVWGTSSATAPTVTETGTTFITE